MDRVQPGQDSVVSLSDFLGENVIAWSKNVPWYKGRRSFRRLTTSRSLSVLLRRLYVFPYMTSKRSLGLGPSLLGMLRRAS